AHYCHFDDRTIDARYLRVGAAFPLAEREMIHREYHSALARRLAPSVARRQIAEILGRPVAARDFIAVPHHMAHAAGAYHSAGFDDALIVTLDGYGEAESGLWSFGLDGDIVRGGETQLPTSLGTLYQIVTSYLGFASFGDEYKVMGLSGYGDPRQFAPVFESLLTLGEGGTYSTAAMARADLHDWLVDALGAVEEPGEYSKRSADIAAALQRRLEEAAFHHLSYLRRETRLDRLCLSGGVALNARMNGSIVRSGLFRQVFVQPAAADDGTALGAALHVHRTVGRGAVAEPIGHVFWGPAYGPSEIERALRAEPRVRWERCEDVAARVASLLADGHIVGWFQGRMGMGPRALGARSIVANPTSVAVRDRLNAMVKGRETFRPFAPSVLADGADDYFEMPDDRTAAPYMLVTYAARETARGRIPGVVHADGSSRVQIVGAAPGESGAASGEGVEPARYRRLLRAFHERTGIPIVLNTSFNRAGEPIVCDPTDAVRCFLASGLDALAIGDFLVTAGAPGARGGVA
ncbi:MAG TPA: carbamoyltransferase C-terminal domain-containing protein, partial [Candidatus Eisenbacteria bacterium]